MVVSRDLCFATSGPQPSGQLEIFNLGPFNYSKAVTADTIMKIVSERQNTMFPVVKKSGTMLAHVGCQSQIPRNRKPDFAHFLKTYQSINFFEIFLHFLNFLRFL